MGAGDLLDKALDISLLGYTRIGHRLRASDWSIAEDAMVGRRVIVTGATSGLGRATALQLLALGAEVWAVGRNREKLEALERDASAIGSKDRLFLERADLSSIRQTRELADRLLTQDVPFHVLVNNAGVLLNRHEVTSEGFEKSFATNLLSHFVLTETLLPALRRGAPARVINVSSGGMYTQRLQPDDLQLEKMDRFDGVISYAHAKRGQVVLTELWAERWNAEEVVVHSMHPGWADTPGVKRSLPLFRRITQAVLRDAEQGADTTVWLCADPQVANTTGLFWHDRKPRPTHRSRKTRETQDERRAFWETLVSMADSIA